MKVSIIFATYNVEKNIRNLLNSIYIQKFDGELEVLVMDSSNDNTQNIVKEFPDVQLIRVEPEDYNYGETRNSGISITSGEYIIIISADIEIYDKDWLIKLLEPLKDPLIAGVYGRHIPKKGASPMEEFFINYTYPPIRKEFYKENQDKIEEIFFSTVNAAIKREIWEKIPFPIMIMAEDLEWAKRALLAGYKIVYEPKAEVLHSHNYSLKMAFRRFYENGVANSYIYQDDRIKKFGFFFKGIKYEYSEIKYLIKKGNMSTIPYALLYDFMKFLGYFLGTKYKYMPIWLRKRLSKKKGYWDKYNNVILKSEKGEYNENP